MYITDPCKIDPCGKNALCSISEDGERECSCSDDLMGTQGDPLTECYGKLLLSSI